MNNNNSDGAQNNRDPTGENSMAVLPKQPKETHVMIDTTGGGAQSE